jgi:hypothetical protein
VGLEIEAKSPPLCERHVDALVHPIRLADQGVQMSAVFGGDGAGPPTLSDAHLNGYPDHALVSPGVIAFS